MLYYIADRRGKWETMAYPIICLVIAFWNVCRLSSQCHCTLSVLLLHHHCKQRRCYCSISWINNRRFNYQNNRPAWAIHSLKSIHSHSILWHTDSHRLGVSLCYSTTSSITGKSVRHLEWVRNTCCCIEVLPRVTHAKLVSLTSPCCSGWPAPMYSAHDWRAATSVQRAPVTWREWGLCFAHSMRETRSTSDDAHKGATVNSQRYSNHTTPFTT